MKEILPLAWEAVSDRPRAIVFENADYIAINKRAGWLVHQTVDPRRPDVFTALKSYLNDLVCAEKDDTNLMTLKYARMGDQVPCLNDDPDHVAALAGLVSQGAT